MELLAERQLAGGGTDASLTTIFGEILFKYSGNECIFMRIYHCILHNPKV